MSRAVEKSIVPLKGFFNSLLGSSGATCNSSNTNLQNVLLSENQNLVSFGLINFVERLEVARKISKQEEEELLIDEYQTWVQQASHKSTGSSTIADILCRSLITFSRGHYFANLYINAIKLTQCDKMINKKLGYLYITRTMAPGSDLSVLLVNTMQKDLSSNNILEISCGLSLVPIVTTPDISPVIVNSLLPCFQKQQDYIRKRAIIMAATVAVQASDNCSSSLSVMHPILLYLLSDSDPSVAIASCDTLSLIYQIIDDVETKNEIRDRVTICCADIILQATGGALSKNYSISVIPAPFVQVKLLRVIKRLSSSAWDTPDIVKNAIHSVLTQPWGGRNLTLYMTYIEGIIAASNVQKDDLLVSLSLQIILGFLKSSYIDFKYMGIKTLTQVFGYLEDSLSKDHLESVLECLYSSCGLLQSRTVSLLCSMANRSNYQAICMTLKELLQHPSCQMNRSTILKNLADILKRLNVDLPWCFDFLSPLLIADDSEQLQFFEALTLSTSSAFVGATSDDEKFALVACCHKLFNLLLDLQIFSFHQIDAFSAILNIIFQSNVTDKLETLTVKMFLDKLKNGHCDKLTDNIIECLLNCGLFLPDCKDIVMVLLDLFLETADLYFYYKIKEKISFLNQSDITQRLLLKRTRIVRGDYIPDFSLSFYDSTINDYLKNNKLCIKVYEPLEALTLPSHEYSNMGLSISSERKTGFVNPFDRPCSNSSNTSVDQETTSTSESVQSTSFETINSRITTKSFDASFKPTWTSKGRRTQPVDANEKRIDLNEDLIAISLSTSSVSSTCIEIAHEANESLTQEPVGVPIQSLSFIEGHKAELTKALMRGLGFSKD